MVIVKSYGGGETANQPMVLGKADASKAVFVEATGLYMGILKGAQAWVTGDEVQPGIARGSLVPLGVPIDSLVSPPKRVVVVKTPGTEGIRPEETASMVAASKHETSEPLTAENQSSSSATDDYEAVIVEPDAETITESAESDYDPGEHPVSDVIAYIEGHPDESAAILAAETAGRSRKTLLREFE